MNATLIVYSLFILVNFIAILLFFSDDPGYRKIARILGWISFPLSLGYVPVIFLVDAVVFLVAIIMPGLIGSLSGPSIFTVFPPKGLYFLNVAACMAVFVQLSMHRPKMSLRKRFLLGIGFPVIAFVAALGVLIACIPLALVALSELFILGGDIAICVADAISWAPGME